MSIKDKMEDVLQKVKPNSGKVRVPVTEQEITEHIYLAAICALLLAGVLMDLAWMIYFNK